ncbi:MAG TPA: hypothetical protein VL769_02000 [Acidimicrobiia bacterium]|nr:hypothetical protein [Acidimicrobiia bacterium]
MESTRTLHTVGAALSGLRRVDYLKMVEDDRPRFFVVGVGHRFPIEREVSANVARTLLDRLPCRYEWRSQKQAS